MSDKNDKTVTVSVERAFQHPVLKKTVRKSKKYRAHDEENIAREGETVRIIECAPKSRSKRWELVTPAIDEQLKAATAERTQADAVAQAASAAEGGAAT